MSVSITIHDGPLEKPSPLHVGGAGALVCFDGIVRPTEGIAPIAALDYEVYSPMAEQMLEALARELLQRHGLMAVAVEHSRGRVPAGACSFRLRIGSRHRKEAIAAMDEFIDRMKQDVPIWKRAVAEAAEVIP